MAKLGREQPGSIPRVAEEVTFWFPPGDKPVPGEIAPENLIGLDPANPTVWVTWEGLGAHVASSEGMLGQFLALDRTFKGKRLRIEDLWRLSGPGIVRPTAHGKAQNEATQDGVRFEILAELLLTGHFFEEFGPIALCTHLWPRWHCTDYLENAVPLDAVRFYVQIARGLLLLSKSIHDRTEAGSAKDLAPLHAVLKRRSPERPVAWTDITARKNNFADVISELLWDAHVVVAVRWPESASFPELAPSSLSPGLTQVLFQLVDTARAADLYAICSNDECGALIDLAKRKRRPIPGRGVYCPDCQRSGARKRESYRRRRSEKKLAQEEGVA